jgi:PKD repeat protein
MKRRITSKIITPLALILLAISFISGYSQTFHKDYIDGLVYLKFKDNVQVNIPVNEDKSVDLGNAPFLDALRQQFDILGLTRPYDLNNDSKLLRTFQLSFSEYDKIDEIKAVLVQNPDLEYAENVPMYYIEYTPNDSLYNREYMSSNWNWNLDVINAEMAWDLNMGSPDINVAIVDNAVWIDHPDLTNKIVLSHDVTTAGNQNSNPPGTGDPGEWSHGTHVAGLVGAESDNLIGVASIGYDVSLIGVKASSSNPGQINGGFAGIQWAANNGADVINCSWGGSGYSTSEQNVMNTVWGMGIVVVAAAGNNAVNTPHYPSAYNHVISVASTNENDVKSDFSNYGATVDVCAPGGYGNAGPQGLMSTTYEETASYGYYNTYFGTSMASPMTSGLCGLIFSVNPELTPDELEAILEASCDDIDAVPGNESWAGQLGAGRINAYAAVSTTPYVPVADFITDVPYITPGTMITFYDQSVGVPDSWSWEFTGGTPHLSSQQDPNVIFNTEGVFTVALGVENDFGSDVETKAGYITVTSTPLPWILFSSDITTGCNADIVTFTDESLYDPTSWDWEINPSTVTFVDGTNAGSQNPHIQFNAPGVYSVTLTATNANGSNSKTIDEMITIHGIGLNYSEDFESGESNDFQISHNTKARIKVDLRAAAPGSTQGLHFQGAPLTGGWSGGPANTTPDQAWNVNTNFHAFADICSVDATGIAGVGLTFDLRQTYSIGNKYSWFRVVVNGEQVADIYGVENYNPTTNTDPWGQKTFDLSANGNSQFSLTLQSSCYLADKFYAEGDNVFVDNVMISNTTIVNEGLSSSAGVLTYPNPAKTVLHYSAAGTGENVILKVMNVHGQVIFSESISNYKDGDIRQVNTENLKPGIYILQLSGDKGSVVKKFVKE